MNQPGLISNTFLLIIMTISLMVAYAFWKIKNGRIRILMIRLFLSKVWLYGVSFVYFFGGSTFGWFTWLSFEAFRIIVLLPMAIVMLQIYNYLRNNT